MARTVLIPTVLSDEQSDRRDRVVAAATELAEAGGYDAVVMKAVADRSGVALATIYRWFASKDHLLTEVLLAWGGELSTALSRRPARRRRRGRPGRRAARPGHGRRRIAPAAGRGRRRRGALGRRRARSTRRASSTRWSTGWIGIALGDAEVPERDAVIQVLEHVCFSAIIGLATGRQSAADATAELATAARLLLRDTP